MMVGRTRTKVENRRLLFEGRIGRAATLRERSQHACNWLLAVSDGLDDDARLALLDRMADLAREFDR